MLKDINKIIHTEEEIKKKVEELAEKINSDFKGQEFVAIGILKSALYFFMDLVRALPTNLIIDFLEISDYGTSQTQSKEIRIVQDVEETIKSKHVLIVEDLIDTGLTMNYILSHIKSKEPASIKICTLINRTKNRIVNIPVTYTGFFSEDNFLVGYGSDMKGLYRHLPFICTLK